VCVVGAGYTGLWTAYYLARAAPQLGVHALYAAYRAEHRGRPTTSPLARIADVVSGRD
jgi:glycine/D-amino acid oxidase-like deaminating enzyme